MMKYNIGDRKWQNYRLGDLFDIKRGYYSKKPPVETGGVIPFIGASQKKNGITGFYKKDTVLCYNRSGQKTEPNSYGKIYPGQCLTINNNGSVGFVHYQNGLFCCSSDVTAVYRKGGSISKELGLFLKGVITAAVKDKYGYGYKLNNTRMNGQLINLPADSLGNPDWEFMENFMREKIEKKEQEVVDYYLSKVDDTVSDNLTFDGIQWGAFPICLLFEEKARGRRLKVKDREVGDIPFVTAGKYNNGVTTFVSNEDHKLYENAITVDMFGNAFYQSSKFKCDDNITVLKNNNFSEYMYEFLVSVMRPLSDKYTYGRQLRPSRLERDKITLPMTTEGTPDWEFMENYMKMQEQRKIREVLDFYTK